MWKRQLRAVESRNVSKAGSSRRTASARGRRRPPEDRRLETKEELERTLTMAMNPALASSTRLLTSSCSDGGSLKCSVTLHGAPAAAPAAAPPSRNVAERADEGARGRGAAAEDGARSVACEDESPRADEGNERSAAEGDERGAKTDASELGRVEGSCGDVGNEGARGRGGRREGWCATWW